MLLVQRCIWVFGPYMAFWKNGCMENTPAVCADDLPSILRICKNCQKSRSVNNSLSSGWIWTQTVDFCFTSQSSAQGSIQSTSGLWRTPTPHYHSPRVMLTYYSY